MKESTLSFKPLNILDPPNSDIVEEDSEQQIKAIKHRPIKNLENRQFGKLTVVSFDGFSDRSVPKWTCLCECGNDKIASAYDLLSGRTVSCGCYSTGRISALNKTHGLSETVGYKAWCGAKDRVFNEKSEYWLDYGGRGIGMCQEWEDSFEAFWRDMGPTWKEGLSLDRIDVNGDYCKENCRWTTMSVQDHNKRKRKNCSSQYIGVTFHTKTCKWEAGISINGKRDYLGCFQLEITAARVYDNRSEELYGDRPNKTSSSTFN